MTVAGTLAPITPPMTRREFLYYIWAASMALFTAELGGAMLWFALPRFKAGEFGGTFTYPISEIPAVDAPPKDYPDGRFWLVNVGPQRSSDNRQTSTGFEMNPGVAAIYKVCVHLGCLYKWVAVNDRFECPCHGSKYLATGTRVGGPATRNLDVFVMSFLDENQKPIPEAKTVTGNPGDPNVGGPIVVPPNAVFIKIDTGKRIQGAPNSYSGPV